MVVVVGLRRESGGAVAIINSLESESESIVTTAKTKKEKE
jgi:hypothetical protein